MAAEIVKPVLPRIRRGAPIARGLTGALPFTEGRDAPRDVVSGALCTFGGTTPTWTGGKHGWALDFTSGRVVWPSGFTNAIKGRATWSLGLSFQADAFGSPGGVLLDAPSLGAFDFILEFKTTDGFYWGVGGGGTNFRTYTGVSLQAGRWYRLLLVKTGTGDNGDLYLDGVKLLAWTGVLDTTPSSTASDMYIGTYRSGSTDVDGRIDGVTTWGRALSAAEIAEDAANPYTIYEWPRFPPRSLFATTATASNEEPAAFATEVELTNRISVDWTPAPGRTIDETLLAITVTPGGAQAVTYTSLGSGAWRAEAFPIFSEETAYSVEATCETTDTNVNTRTWAFTTRIEAPATLALVDQYVASFDPRVELVDVAVRAETEPTLVPVEVVTLAAIDALYESLALVDVLSTITSLDVGFEYSADIGIRTDDVIPVSADVNADFAEQGMSLSIDVTGESRDVQVDLSADISRYVEEQTVEVSADIATRTDDHVELSAEVGAAYAEMPIVATLRCEQLAAIEDNI